MLLNGEGTPAQKNAALPGVHKKIEAAAAALGDAKTALRPIPAKALATDLDPNAKRARPRLERRGLQMVLRLLAFNAEAWIAEHFNAYLTDPNDYRAIPRNLLHQGGQVDYTTNTITITLDRPDSPRVGLRIPLDLSVISFDDEYLASYLRPQLSSLQIPYLEMGRLAMDLVLDGDPPAQTLVPMPLQERGSVRDLNA